MTIKATSLRSRLAAMMGLLFLGGLAALYFAASAYAKIAADHSYDRLLFGSALSIMDTLSVARGQIQTDLPYASLDMLSAAPDDKVFYRVVGPHGETVTGYRDLPSAPGGFAAGPRRAAEQADFFDARYRGEPVRFVVLGRRIAQPGATGWVWTQVGQTKLARNRLARELLLSSLIPIAVLTALALALVWMGIGRALRPLQSVGAEISARDPSDLQPIVAPVPAEIAPVIQAMNGFMARLEGNIEALRMFIADAAHQVRTPLAALLAQVQVASDSLDDPDELRSRLGAVQRNAEKLGRLTNQLLSDATIRHRSDVGRFEEVDIMELIRQAVRDCVPLSEDYDVRFTTALKAAPCRGDGLVLSEAVKNLIHNALHHGASGEAEVDIRLKRDGHFYVVTVSDRGPGIPDPEKARVFDRFVRGSSTQPGAGLGLAIVLHAVERHEGRIRLRDRDGGGLTVEIRLPVSGQ